MRNRHYSDNTVLRQALERLRERLPSTWGMTWRRCDSAGDSGADSRVEVSAPDRSRIRFLVAVRRVIDPRSVSQLISARPIDAGQRWVLVAPFIGSRVQERLQQANWGYLDLTGNLQLHVDRPALWLRERGAVRSPWPEDRPSRSLKGAKAARVVRALCDFLPPVGIRELAARAGTDPGYVSRIVAFLDREGLVDRGVPTPSRPEPKRHGPVTSVRWRELLGRWSEDYSLLGSHRTAPYLDARGLGPFMAKLAKAGFRHAVTASLAASKVAPSASPRLAVCYVDDLEQAAASLALVPADSGANVILAEPFDGIVYERGWAREGVSYAAPTQVVVDLLTSPGRGPAEAAALIGWMEQNPNAWRT